MCLIAGGMGINIKPKLIGMIESGKHRGGDSFGVWTEEGVLKSDDFSEVNDIPNGRLGLLQCRLAMTGSKTFTQPFFNDYVLVHNGEIYNHVQIRVFLEERGISFESDVDTEVILRLLEFLVERGESIEKAVRHTMECLRGDYAVAFSDKEDIYLFRDPVGIRPLYYSPNGFFASEKKVLWSIGEDAIPVEPGEFVKISRGGIKKRRLLSILELKGKDIPYERAKEGLKKALDYATKSRAGNKVGILFSGGLDSSLLALIASKYGDVVLYTAGAEGSQDLEWARSVSAELDLPLREYVFDMQDVEEAIPRVMFAIEDPNPMNLAIGVPIYFATKLAGDDGIRILLSGQGADELFGGYAKYLKNPGLMEKDLLELSEKNLVRDDKVAMLNGVEGRLPVLDLNIVKLALSIPLRYKIEGGLRKKILREVALEMGLPRRVAYREKKACQYGSNSQRMIERIAKRRDMRLGEFARNIYEKVFKKPAP